MKILHINCNYMGSTLHQLMIQELNKMGIQNEVFVPTYDRNIGIITPIDNVYVSECFEKWDRLLFDYKQKKIIHSIEKYYDVSSFDLIHAYTLFTDGNAARVLSEKYHVPYVVAIRNTDVNDFFKHMVHLRGRGVRNMMEAQSVFFLSRTYKDLIFDRYIPDKKENEIARKVNIIPNGIDTFWFDNVYSEKNRTLGKTIKLIYAGVIDKNKNITATQDAMKILRKEGVDCKLTVVGKIKDEKVYKKVVKDKYTEFYPATDKHGLIKLYRESDIFIMPSIKETFGLVYAEAMSQGLPVIYTKGQGFDGQYDEGTVGYHVNCKDAVDIASKIKDIIMNYEQFRICVPKYSLRFNWSSICKMYYSIYKELI